MPTFSPRIYCLSLLIASLLSQSLTAEEPKVDFNRDIRPILSDNCFLCHGPDAGSREADLRLDQRDAAVNAGAISETNWKESSVLARILSADPEERMPPPSSQKHLSKKQIELIEKWLSEGAPYSGHWAFTAPARPSLPNISLPSEFSHWTASAVDAFVFDKLNRQGLRPSPVTNKSTLLKRVYLDLTGLPPSPADVEAFLDDNSTDAYEKVVQRLLQSEAYGEKWGRWWLDAARYADSDGYEKDKPRDVWFYRDWVINALNQDLPYDQFIIKQVAGDLLPKATQDDIVATGFLRNSMVNEEGGADPEQFRVEGMFDRMDAIGKSILGITTQCAQCHSHKYDPLTQKEYYQMFAALNDFHEAIVTVYTPEQQKVIQSLNENIDAIHAEIKKTMPEWKNALLVWSDNHSSMLPNWTSVRPTELPYDGQKFRLLEDNSIVSESYAPTQTTVNLPVEIKPGEIPGDTITAFRLDALCHPQLPHSGPGRSIYGTGALTEFQATVTSLRDNSSVKVKFVKAYSDVNAAESPLQACFRQKDAEKDDRVTGPIDYAVDGNGKTAWTTDAGPGRRNQDCHAIFVPESPISIGDGVRVTFALQMNHGGWNSDDNQNYLIGRYRLSVTSDSVEATATIPNRVEAALRLNERNDDHLNAIFEYWLSQVEALRESVAAIESAWKQHPEPTSQLAVEHLDAPRESFVMLRGDFLNRGEIVQASAPGFMHPLQQTDEPSRLRFARWLVDRNSPTTARVLVNRVWQSYFGRGFVTTPEDFGYQSPAPTHPELLDWLSVEFMDSGWNIKHLHRLIVMSQTYRQSSKVSSQLLEIDPTNTWLSRGPRFRVDAESVRDIALAAGGILNRTVGGPSVFPPAPEFLFEPPASYGPKVWPFRDDSSQYRRSVYVHRYRSVPYPPLQVFDAPKGDAACVRRERSNTPLQALVMLNEPQFLQCARAMATRVLREADSQDAERIRYAFMLCTARYPDAQEFDVLSTLLEQQKDRVASGELQPNSLVGLTDSQSLQMTGFTAGEVLPWIVVCRVILNLDETITKE